MFNFPLYKATKLRIKNIAQTFIYLRQYEVGKDNTSYKVPAIYVELPPNNSVATYKRKVRVAKKSTIRIHYISNAPFKNHDNTIQDSALAEHYNNLKAIDGLLQGWHAVSGDDLLTQQWRLISTSEMRFLNNHVVTILSYSTDIYEV